MSARTWALAGCLASLGSAANAVPPAPTGPSTVDLIEHLFGASNVNAVVGNGRLTVGVSALGDGAVLSWPSPSYTDQLLHLGDNDLEVRSRRKLALADAMGTFVGVRVKRGGDTVVAFPRDEGWRVTQRFADPKAARLTTTFESDTLALRVVVDDAVGRDADVWVRTVRVVATGGAPIDAVEVLGYWNLSPTLSRVPQLPLADWAMDAWNDYAAAWSQADQRIVHYRPAGRGDILAVADLIARPAIDYGPIGDALRDGPVDAARADALIDGLAAEPDGAYFVIAADEAVVGHQIGFDTTPTCALLDRLADHIKALPDAFPGLILPLDPALVDILRCTLTPASLAADNGWSALPAAAFEDLADGVLEGANAAAGQVDTALAVNARRDGDGFAATFRLGAGASLAAAISAARAGADEVLTVDARLPSDPAIAEVAARALMNVLLAQDASTGAIVASVSRQAPYALDWPRDGAFFTAALDVAGLVSRASQRVPWVLARQRTEPVPAEPIINGPPPVDPTTGASDTYPAGAWEMNYYADGLVGGNIRWEIDNTALTVWSLVDHGRYLDTAAREAHEVAIFPAVQRAAELLMRWKDPATGLQAPASEDDNALYTQTLHGAITTWAGLNAARGLALARPDLDVDARGQYWAERVDELRRAILEHLVDPVSHRFREGLDEATNPGNAAGGPSAWALWPARFLRDSVPAEAAIKDATEAWLLDLAEARLEPANGGSAYVAKLLLAVAISTTDDARKARVKTLLERLATRTSTSDTRVFGEVFVAVDGDGDGAADGFSPRVSNPHVWAGTLVYLTAMALEAPERFDRPVGPAPDPERADDGGCAGGGGVPGNGLVMLVWLVSTRLLLVGRRRR